VCVGTATKLVELLTGRDKAYAAVIRFGARSTTLDAEGPIEAGGSVPPPAELVAAVEHRLTELSRDYPQLPPKFSAKKIAGEPAHRLARRGEVVELEAKRVKLAAWRVGEPLEGGVAPFPLPLTPCGAETFDLRVAMEVGSGFYVRSLARDLGDAVGCGAYLVGLRRDSVGSFGLAEALTPATFGGEELDLRAALAHPTLMRDDPASNPLRPSGQRFPPPTEHDTARAAAALLPPDAAARDFAHLPIAPSLADEIDAGRLDQVPWLCALGEAPPGGSPVWVGALDGPFRALGEATPGGAGRIVRRLTTVQRSWLDWIKGRALPAP
jgi:tRNA pseudouridine(55) synthase